MKSFTDIFSNAKWIGSGEPVFYAPYFSVFALSCDMEIPVGGVSASIILGACDERFSSKSMNILGVEGDCYVRFQLDISVFPAVVKVWRVGFGDSEPLFVLPAKTVTTENANKAHTLSLEMVYGQCELYLDGENLNAQPKDAPMGDGPMPFFFSTQLNLNPFGRGGDFTCWPMLGKVGFSAPEDSFASFSNLEIRNYRKPRSLLYRQNDAKEVSGTYLFDPSSDGMPVLKTEFEVLPGLEKATLTATARGIYELCIMGQKVGDTVFEPGLTQYNKSQLYQVYDVTRLLRPGACGMEAALGEGWWSGSISFTGGNWNFFGDRQSFICRLELEYKDGTKREIVTNPDSWLVSTDGQIRYGSFFQGEVWDDGQKPNNWRPAVEILLDETNTFIGETVGGPENTVTVVNYDNQKYIQGFGGAYEAAKFPALSVTEPKPGVYVYDVGQNMAGIPEIRFPAGLKGREITMRFAEILYPALPEYGDLAGTLMTENLRGAHCVDAVILPEGETVFRPKFTFHGFRYIELTGLDSALPLENVKAVALSSTPELTADFSCSNEKVNKLFSNIGWSLKSNFLSVPTDCPQRNERMGWSGDLSVFSRTAVYMSNCRDFLDRHLLALRDTQKENGCYEDIAPIGGGFGGVLWSTVGITAAWELYRQYGDIDAIARHYPSMVRYMNHLDACVGEDGATREGALGDWLGPENGKIEQAILWTAYHVYDLRVMAGLAKALGKTEDAEAYKKRHDERKAAFNRLFIDSDTGKTVYSSEKAAKSPPMMGPPGMGGAEREVTKLPSGKFAMDTQTSYAAPLALGAVSDENLAKVRQNLIACCQRENKDDGGAVRPPYSLMTGFIGTAFILAALSDAGREDVAYKMLQNEDYPSWLYPVNQGATTIWERLNSYTVENGFGGNNSMNSFNHYSFGSVGAWMLSVCLGFGRGETGFKNAKLCPTPDPTGQMTYAQGSLKTDAGEYFLRWEAADKGFKYYITVPEAASPTLYLKALPGSALVGAVAEKVENGRYVISLKPGKYEIEVK